MIKVIYCTDPKTNRLISATGKCVCGNILDMLDSEYDGTVECEKCGALYNGSGQRLLPRDQWEENLEED